MFRSRDRVQRSGREEADDALLFVPRTIAYAFVTGQRYADSSSSHATGRGHCRGDPGGRWLALSVRTPRGLNARRAAGSTRPECQAVPRCGDNSSAVGPSVMIAILATLSPRRLPSTRARTSTKSSTSTDGKTKVTGRHVPIGELSARTFCTLAREFSSFRRRERSRENDVIPDTVSARLLGRPCDPLLRGRRSIRQGPRD